MNFITHFLRNYLLPSSTFNKLRVCKQQKMNKNQFEPFDHSISIVQNKSYSKINVIFIIRDIFERYDTNIIEHLSRTLPLILELKWRGD